MFASISVVDSRLDFFDYLNTTLACHFRVHTYSDKVFVGRHPFKVGCCGVFTQCFVWSDVVSWRQSPNAILTDETEVSGMVIEIAYIMVENHSTKLLFNG